MLDFIITVNYVLSHTLRFDGLIQPTAALDVIACDIKLPHYLNTDDLLFSKFDGLIKSDCVFVHAPI